MERYLLAALLLGCVLNAVSARNLLDDASPAGAPGAAPSLPSENGTSVSYCGTVAPEDRALCCAAAQAAGIYESSCPSSTTGQCHPEDCDGEYECCEGKFTDGQYDPSCDLGDYYGSCASWPPAHRKQCCEQYKFSDFGYWDAICYPLADCNVWSYPRQVEMCCVSKTASAIYDASCPRVPAQCITYPPGPSDLDTCCNSKVAFGLYDAACPITDACSTYPPQHRHTCCTRKYPNTDPACATPDLEAKDCSYWSPGDLPYCCALKASKGIADPRCSTSTVPPTPGALPPTPDVPPPTPDAGVWPPSPGSWPPTMPDAGAWPPPTPDAGMWPPTAGAWPPPAPDAGTWPPTPDVWQPTPDVWQPTPDVWQPTPDVWQPTPDVWQPTPDVWDPTPDMSPPSPGGSPPMPGITPTPSPPEVCKFPCGDSCIISLPKVSLPNDWSGRKYLLGLQSETEADRAASADRFCKDMGYGGAGTSDNFHLLPQFHAGASAWATYNPVSDTFCNGPLCPVVGIVECVKAGGRALVKDANGNVGCNNTGSNAIGSNNQGSRVRGNNNSGSDLWGDNNTGSGVIGSGNTRSGFIGNNDGPFTL